MPKRREEPERVEVMHVLDTEKWLPESPSEIARQARLGGYCGGGGRKRGPMPPWSITVTVQVIATMAGPFERSCVKLFVRDQPVLGLEHHLRSVRNDDGTLIPAGYHWDLHRPLSDSKTREIPAHQPANAVEAVTMLMTRAKILWQNSLEL